jgi:hypothetical protein
MSAPFAPILQAAHQVDFYAARLFEAAQTSRVEYQRDAQDKLDALKDEIARRRELGLPALLYEYHRDGRLGWAHDMEKAMANVAEHAANLVDDARQLAGVNPTSPEWRLWAHSRQRFANARQRVLELANLADPTPPAEQPCNSKQASGTDSPPCQLKESAADPLEVLRQNAAARRQERDQGKNETAKRTEYEQRWSELANLTRSAGGEEWPRLATDRLFALARFLDAGGYLQRLLDLDRPTPAEQLALELLTRAHAGDRERVLARLAMIFESPDDGDGCSPLGDLLCALPDLRYYAWHGKRRPKVGPTTAVARPPNYWFHDPETVDFTTVWRKKIPGYAERHLPAEGNAEDERLALRLIRRILAEEYAKVAEILRPLLDMPDRSRLTTVQEAMSRIVVAACEAELASQAGKAITAPTNTGEALAPNDTQQVTSTPSRAVTEGNRSHAMAQADDGQIDPPSTPPDASVLGLGAGRAEAASTHSSDRLRFDDLTLTITLDDKPFSNLDPAGYHMVKYVHSRNGQLCKGADIRRNVSGVHGRNAVSQKKKTLPKPIRACIRGTPGKGYHFVLPPDPSTRRPAARTER